MKKVILVLLALIAVNVSNAQQLRIDEVDDFTGDVKKFSNYYNVAKTEVGLIKVSTVRINSSYFMKVISTFDLGCSGVTGNYIIVMFADGTRVEIRKDHSDIDCSKGSASLFVVKDGSPLFTKEITKIRFKQSEYYTDGVTAGTYSLAQLFTAVK